MVRTLAVAISALLVGAGLAVPEARATATYGLGTYLYKTFNSSTGDCTGRKIDPVNIRWTGQNATYPQVRQALFDRLNWTLVPGAFFRIPNHGSCTGQDTSAGKEFGPPVANEPHKEKIHIRLFQDAESSDVVGDAHRERKVLCQGQYSDSVYPRFDGRSGFDYGAYRVRRAFEGSQRVRYIRGSQDDLFVQCNGDKVRWNGGQVVIDY